MSVSPEPVRLQGRQDVATLREHIASEVRAEMARRRVVDAEIAHHLGQNQQWFSRRKLGYVPFDAAELVLIADYLGVPVTQLLGLVARSSESGNEEGPRSERNEGLDVRPKGFEPLTF